MGFTLRAALAELGAGAEIEVAELVPQVVEWAKGPMAELFADSLLDARVTMRIADVRSLIVGRKSAYDAILLDVDNGPEGLSRRANDRLYDGDGLRAARDALRPGGVLAVWASSPNSNFTHRLRRTGFGVEETRVRASGPGSGSRHTIWLATRPPA